MDPLIVRSFALWLAAAVFIASSSLAQSLPQPKALRAQASSAATSRGRDTPAADIASVLRSGAEGDNATDDTAAFQSAVTAACATAAVNGGVTEVDVPVPPAAYRVTTPITLCSNLHIHGLGYPTINYSGTNALFLWSGARNIEIDHLDMEGTNAASTYALRDTFSVDEALNVRIHDNIIEHFGNGTSGAGISIEGPSLNLQIGPANVIAGLTADILIDGPGVDTLDIAQNVLSTDPGSPTGPVRCIDFSGTPGGAVTSRIEHNNMTCEGLGALRINTAGNFYIVEDNEAETKLAISNASSAEFELLAAGQIQFNRNTSDSHGLTDYDVYVADAITDSLFSFNFGSPVVDRAFRVGAGIDNVYQYNLSANGPSAVYSRDYPGIMVARATTGDGLSWGCATPALSETEFCSPGITNLAPGAGSTINFSGLTPALAGGNLASIVLGRSGAANDAASITFDYAGGAGSAANTLQLSLVGGKPVSIGSTGALEATSARLAVTTVGALPRCNARLSGTIGTVSDAASPTYLGKLTGGGTIHVLAYCNGNAWVSD